MTLFERLKDALRTLRWGRRETQSALLGVACLALAGALKWKPIATLGLPDWVKLFFAALAGMFWGYTVLRLWRSTLAPKQRKFEPGPVAIKGASSFTPEDAELFSRLGRRDELARLRSWILDDQVPLVVVMGESGVGKTSLLRAGLTFILANGEEPVPSAYWEATPSGGLRRALRAQLDTDALETLPAATVVVDQAEQLDLERDHSFFDCLRDHVASRPPYRTTWIVAFRREFSSEWVDFELDLPEGCVPRIKKLSLRRFAPRRAKKVFSTLVEEAKLSASDALVDDILTAVTEKGTVSPVDLGITLQVLASQRDLVEQPDALRSVGGHAGLLVSYLESVLELYSSEQRNETFRALLELINEEEEQRFAEGRTLSDLVTAVEPASPNHFEMALRTLAEPGVRVLEAIEAEAETYRLVHERFIPAIRRLAGKLLTETDNASRLLERRWRQWDREEQQSRFLLQGRDLRSVEQQRAFLRWGEHAEGKIDFLRRSLARRRASRLASAALLATLLGLGTAWVKRSHDQKMRDHLHKMGIPRITWDVLDKITDLDLRGLETHDIHWLKTASVKSLRLRPGPGLTNLEGLPESLKSLHLDLSSSQITSLESLPVNLKELTLSLNEANITELDKLPKGITKLSLDLSRSHVKTLDKLPLNVEKLDLNLSESQIKKLNELPPNTQELDIHLANSHVTSLDKLPQRIQKLSLKLSKSQIKTLDKLPPNIQELNLNLSESQIETLDKLPTNTQDLYLRLTDSKIKSLNNLPKRIKKLELGLEKSNITKLDELPKTIENITLNLIESNINNLSSLPKNIKSITARIDGDLTPELNKLSDEVKVDFLYITDISDVKELPKNTQTLSLKISGKEMPELDNITKGVPRVRLFIDEPQSTELAELAKEASQLDLVITRLKETSLNRLPGNIRRLVLLASPRQDIDLDNLPENIQDLRITTIGASLSGLGNLPKGIKKLHLASENLAELDKLPENIQELSLLLQRQTIQLDHFPRETLALQIELRNSQLATLENIPKKLVCLRLITSPFVTLSLSRLPDKIRRFGLTVLADNQLSDPRLFDDFCSLDSEVAGKPASAP